MHGENCEHQGRAENLSSNAINCPNQEELNLRKRGRKKTRPKPWNGNHCCFDLFTKETLFFRERKKFKKSS